MRKPVRSTTHLFFMQVKQRLSGSSRQERCHFVHLGPRGFQSLFTDCDDEILISPHWFLGEKLIHLWISQTGLILTRVTVLITSALFNASIHHAEPPQSTSYSVFASHTHTEIIRMRMSYLLEWEMWLRVASWKWWSITSMSVMVSIKTKCLFRSTSAIHLFFGRGISVSLLAADRTSVLLFTWRWKDLSHYSQKGTLKRYRFIYLLCAVGVWRDYRRDVKSSRKQTLGFL